MAIGSMIGSAASASLKYGLPVFGAYSTFKNGREQGENVLWTTAKFGAETALYTMAPGVGLAYLGSQLLSGAISSGLSYSQTEGKKTANLMNSAYTRNFGGNFIDTQNSATMRQRGLEAIHHSGNNLNQVFGSEARTFYRGMR